VKVAEMEVSDVINNASRSGEELIINLRTWNVLADAYCFAERYPDSPAELLTGGARDELICAVLADGPADVVCLQEIEEGLARDVVEALGEGWDARWCPKGQGRGDGCLSAVRWPWVVWDEQRLYYADAVDGGADSGHVAQILTLINGGSNLVLANTHLRWGDGQAGAGQVGQREARELVAKLAVAHPGLPVCVVGDINDRVGGPVRDVLAEAGFVEVQGDEPTAVVEGEAVSLDVVAVRGARGVSHTRAGRTDGALPDFDCPSDHVCVDVALLLG
jgi:endonuclease/exonuclease/phosphatase family metal-dependent hydrolase